MTSAGGGLSEQGCANQSDGKGRPGRPATPSEAEENRRHRDQGRREVRQQRRIGEAGEHQGDVVKTEIEGEARPGGRRQSWSRQLLPSGQPGEHRQG